MDYKSTHTGQQIDAGVTAALNPDTTPTTDSDALITSGGAKAALDGKQNMLTFDSAPTAGSNNPVTSSGIKSALNAKADQTDLTSIIQTGTTCTEANGIAAGVYFYLNGDMVCAKTAIANGATFTLNTNYEYPSAGALNALKSAISDAKNLSIVATYEPTYGAKVKPITEGVDGLRVSVLSNGSKRLRGCIYVNPALTAGDVVFTLPSALQYHWQQNGSMQAWLQFTGINTNITFCALLSFLDATVWGNNSNIPVGQYVLSEMEYF